MLHKPFGDRALAEPTGEWGAYGTLSDPLTGLRDGAREGEEGRDGVGRNEGKGERRSPHFPH